MNRFRSILIRLVQFWRIYKLKKESAEEFGIDEMAPNCWIRARKRFRPIFHSAVTSGPILPGPATWEIIPDRIIPDLKRAANLMSIGRPCRPGEHVFTPESFNRCEKCGWRHVPEM